MIYTTTYSLMYSTDIIFVQQQHTKSNKQKCCFQEMHSVEELRIPNCSNWLSNTVHEIMAILQPLQYMTYVHVNMHNCISPVPSTHTYHLIPTHTLPFSSPPPHFPLSTDLHVPLSTSTGLNDLYSATQRTWVHCNRDKTAAKSWRCRRVSDKRRK